MNQIRNIPTHVYKFGGSSVGNSMAIKRVAELCMKQTESQDKRLVVVLSAMYGVTNKLIEAAEAAISGNQKIVKDKRKEVFDLHMNTCEDLFAAGAQADMKQKLDGMFNTYFDSTIQKLQEKKDGEDEKLNVAVLSGLGERLSNELAAEYVRQKGHGSKAFHADHNLLVTTGDDPTDSKPVLNATRERVQKMVVPCLEKGEIPFVTGFLGCTETSKTTVLGRGGSDLTAAVLGYSVDADEISLYKVESTEKPDKLMDEWEAGWVGVVHDAKTENTIRELDYSEAAELAHFGKKVLHPDTVFPAIEKGIPIAIRNTLEPELPGTVIKAGDGHTKMEDFNISTVTSTELHKYCVKSPLPVLDGVEKEELREKYSLVSLIGVNAMKEESVVQEAVKLLENQAIKTSIPSKVNGSIHNFSIVVDNDNRKKAVKILHNHFVSE